MAVKMYDESKGIFIRWSPLFGMKDHPRSGGPKSDGDDLSSPEDYWANDYWSPGYFGDDYW